MAGVAPFFRYQLRRLFLVRGLTQLVPTAETPSRSFNQPAPVQEDSKPLGYPWRIVVAVCVQRLPSLSREKTDVERRYQKLKEQLRVERSRLSDHELEEREYVKQKRERERQALEEDVVVESSRHSAIEEFEDLLEARQQEVAVFQPSPRPTAVDRSGNMRSVQRQLDKVLYLLVKKDRSSHCWQMPQGGLLGEGESLLQGARRELSEECGSDLRVNFLSSTPSAFLSYHLHHSLPTASDIIGSKVFFLKAQYRGGEVQLNRQELVDHVWVTKEEMREYVEEDYFNSVGSTLMD